jgi:type I restriction enzyme M protein
MFETKLSLSKESNLLKKFEDIHNYIYANDGLSEQQVLDEFIKILFIKFTDEKNNEQLFSISKEEISSINSGFKTDTFLKRIENLFQITKNTFKDVFDSEEKILLSHASLAFLVAKLQNVDFHDSTKDAKGLAFQKFLGRQAKSGRGQFFTPEPVIDFCVEILDIQANQKIIDPACGTGGFIFSALKYIEKTNKNIDIQKYSKENIFGIEINQRITQISKMKFLLECNGEANILCANALSDIDELNLQAETISSLKNLENSFDVVLTNPPFGTQGRISNKNWLAKYELGHKWVKHENTYYKTKKIQTGQVPDILFIERSLELLKSGGKLGIVLPNGLFENSSLEYLRLYLREKANILAVVRLPQETFIPYGTGVKASLLFLQKKDKNIVETTNIFFSKIEKLGYKGNKNGTPLHKKDAFGQKKLNEDGEYILDEDFTKVIQDYKKFQKEGQINTENSFSIENSELKGRLDFDYYAPENTSLLKKLNTLNAVKLGDLVEVIKQKSTKLKTNQLVEYVELSDINTHAFEIINSTNLNAHELPSRASYELKTNDIITAVAGNSIGSHKQATAYVSQEFEGAICTNGFRILRNPKIDPYYLLFYFKSEFFLRQVFMYRTGAAIPSISDTDLANILVYIPNEKELNIITQNVRDSFLLRESAKEKLASIKIDLP